MCHSVQSNQLFFWREHFNIAMRCSNVVIDSCFEAPCNFSFKFAPVKRTSSLTAKRQEKRSTYETLPLLFGQSELVKCSVSRRWANFLCFKTNLIKDKGNNIIIYYEALKQVFKAQVMEYDTLAPTPLSQSFYYHHKYVQHNKLVCLSCIKETKNTSQIHVATLPRWT